MAPATARPLLAAIGLPLAATASTDALFEAFKARYGRSYATVEEEAARLANFENTLEVVERHNADPARTWQMGVNQFSDMTDEEFDELVLMDPQDCSATHAPSKVRDPTAPVDLPAHFDWREKGAVSEVKNQGSCGSCWTFSTVGALEAHMQIKYDSWRAPRLSEQQLVDCAQAFDNHGCSGGLPSHAFEYIRHAGGLSTEFSYPYFAKDGNCTFKGNDSPQGNKSFMPTSAGVGVEVPGGSVNLTVGDEQSLKYHIATHGPVSIAFQVASDFRHYSYGVYTSKVCQSGAKEVNHAVLAVGYGTDPASGLQYWTVKNSWDYTWGVEGFFKIQAFRNMCGLADCMAFPDLYGLNSPTQGTPLVV